MDLICDNCKIPTGVVYDHITKDTMCSECGLVFATPIVDETTPVINNNNNNQSIEYAPESRNLDNNNSSSSNNDNSNKKKKKKKNKNDEIESMNKWTHHFERTSTRLENLADRLTLVDSIRTRGYELYKKVFYKDPKACRVKNTDAILGACFVIASHKEKLPRTLKEICTVLKSDGVTKKDLIRAKNFITKQLKDEPDNEAVVGTERAIRASDLITRFCTNLGVKSNRVIAAAFEASVTCEGTIDLRRSPISVAAAVIYMIVQLEHNGNVVHSQCLKDIADATDVAETTIKHTYRDIYPEATKIVPSWFATHDVVEDVLTPPSFCVTGWIPFDFEDK